MPTNLAQACERVGAEHPGPQVKEVTMLALPGGVNQAGLRINAHGGPIAHDTYAWQAGFSGDRAFTHAPLSANIM